MMDPDRHNEYRRRHDDHKPWVPPSTPDGREMFEADHMVAEAARRMQEHRDARLDSSEDDGAE